MDDANGHGDTIADRIASMGPRRPHSPHATSFWWAHVGWSLSTDHDHTPWHRIQDWARYPELRLLDRFHYVPGVLLAGLCYLVGGWPGLVWGFFVSTVLRFSDPRQR